jgi:hypothetical protein
MQRAVTEEQDTWGSLEARHQDEVYRQDRVFNVGGPKDVIHLLWKSSS